MERMEIGGYRELDLRTGLEYYAGENMARLNAGRCGVYHAARCLGCRRVLLPFYQCETVRTFLLRKGVEVDYYHIGEDLLPLAENRDGDAAIVLVNYFGLIREDALAAFVQRNRNVVIDNTQGFYQPNIPGAYSVYSPRKFFGVADGCYVIGAEAGRFLDEYPQDSSAASSGFLLARLESGGNANYPRYLESERRLDGSDILRMSKLTRALLDNVDYAAVREKRQANYDYVASVFKGCNGLPAGLLERAEGQVPMVYPLLIEREELRHVLKANHIFVGQWWKYLLEEPGPSAFEKRLSKYLLPIQIDQRYGPREIDYTADVIEEALRPGGSLGTGGD